MHVINKSVIIIVKLNEYRRLYRYQLPLPSYLANKHLHPSLFECFFLSSFELDSNLVLRSSTVKRGEVRFKNLGTRLEWPDIDTKYTISRYLGMAKISILTQSMAVFDTAHERSCLYVPHWVRGKFCSFEIPSAQALDCVFALKPAITRTIS